MCDKSGNGHTQIKSKYFDFEYSKYIVQWPKGFIRDYWGFRPIENFLQKVFTKIANIMQEFR